ncbi:MAG: RNA polymerase subunit sigma, partial [Sphingomonadales bacterium 39-62-4]
MKHDHRGFAAARAYKKDETADRIRRFLPMVKRLAWHVHGSGRAGIELEDLIQAGLVALTECSQRHDGPTEDGFAAYAKLRVRGAMVDLVRRSTPLSRSATERRRVLREKTSMLTNELGRPPSDAELAAAVGLSERELADQKAADEPRGFEAIDGAYSDTNAPFAAARPDTF